MTAIETLLPTPPAGPPSEAERARIRGALRTALRAEMAAEHRVATRRRRTRATATPALVAFCLSAVTVLTLVAATAPARQPIDTARPVAASSDAVQALETASRQVALAEPSAPADDQLVYVRSVAVTNRGELGSSVELGERRTREIWLSQEPGPASVYGLIREFGQDWPLGGGGSPAGLRRPTYAYLASLPSDPSELLDELEQQIAPWDDQRTQDQVLFDQIVELISEGLAPSHTTATLYRALTLIPGVEVDDSAHDLLGRPGVGITRTEAVFLTRTVVIIDPQSGETLGANYLMSSPAGEELFGSTAIVGRGIADAAGVEPDVLIPAGQSPRPSPQPAWEASASPRPANFEVTRHTRRLAGRVDNASRHHQRCRADQIPKTPTTAPATRAA